MVECKKARNVSLFTRTITGWKLETLRDGLKDAGLKVCTGANVNKVGSTKIIEGSYDDDRSRQ